MLIDALKLGEALQLIEGASGLIGGENKTTASSAGRMQIDGLRLGCASQWLRGRVSSGSPSC